MTSKRDSFSVVGRMWTVTQIVMRSCW